jgi:sugar transferase (PEP-CTERM/EpsH1 system associated)
MKKPPLLYLAHRIPYPPNKGDKVRSFNLLRHFATNYRVMLGCFVDDPADHDYIEKLGEWCEDVHCEPLNPRVARVSSLRGLVNGDALSLPYYRSPRLARWVREMVTRHPIRHAVVFSSPMTQYLDGLRGIRKLADYCDVDSAKWTAYANDHSGPAAWLYRREGERLLAHERRAGARLAAISFVSEDEAKLFRELAPELAERTHAVSNGVNAEFFSPDPTRESPYQAGEKTIVFTGAMDYWPNIDAVRGFATEVWPEIRRRDAQARFVVVGMNPAPDVRALAADPRIRVTGTVPDVRPYLQHADVIVAPLRIARGIQNKVLEAMAMGRAVVASSAAATGIEAEPGREIAVVDAPHETVEAIAALLADPAAAARIGAAARSRVLARYSWEAHLSKLDPLLEGKSS